MLGSWATLYFHTHGRALARTADVSPLPRIPPNIKQTPPSEGGAFTHISHFFPGAPPTHTVHSHAHTPFLYHNPLFPIASEGEREW